MHARSGASLKRSTSRCPARPSSGLRLRDRLHLVQGEPSIPLLDGLPRHRVHRLSLGEEDLCFLILLEELLLIVRLERAPDDVELEQLLLEPREGVEAGLGGLHLRLAWTAETNSPEHDILSGK